MKLVVFFVTFILLLAGVSGKSIPLDLKALDILFQADVNANCPSGFTQPQNMNFNQCYKVFTDYSTTTEAKRQCESVNGTLASVPNSNVNTYIYYLAANLDASSVWLGSECFNGDKKTCENDDHTPFNYSNFKPGEPSKTGLCISMSATGPDSQKWSAYDCKQKSAFACEVPLGGIVKPSTPCPQGYTLFQEMCYKYVDIGGDPKDYISANYASAECRKIPGGNLATIPNEKVHRCCPLLD